MLDQWLDPPTGGIFYYFCWIIAISSSVQDVMIKKFLQQDISSDAFEEFRTEVYEFPHFKSLKAVQNIVVLAL